MTHLHELQKEAREEFIKIAGTSQEHGGWAVPYEGIYIGEDEAKWLDTLIEKVYTAGRNDAADEIIRDSRPVPGLERCWYFTDASIEAARTPNNS